MNNDNATRFLLTVRDWKFKQPNTLPVWSDPDVSKVFATDPTGRELIVVDVNDDHSKVFVRARKFDAIKDPAIYYHGWWSPLDHLSDFRAMRPNGLIVHTPIVQLISHPVTS